jgi:excinuclease ABC subunit A
MSKNSKKGTQETIDIYGAREHNLKNINIQIPRNKLIVFTGLSGSGKSSLAFDTIFAEGQRRYIDTFSSTSNNLSVDSNVRTSIKLMD